MNRRILSNGVKIMAPITYQFGDAFEPDEFRKKAAQIMIKAANEIFDMEQLLEDLGKLKYLSEQMPRKIPHYHNNQPVKGKYLIDYVRKEVNNIKDLSDDEKIYLGGYLAEFTPNYIASVFY